jgi:pyrroline-5-carboxylate reductase
MKIAFCGGGAMGEAIIAAVLDKELASAHDVTVAETVPERLDHLIENYKIKGFADIRSATSGADVIIIAVKPQSLNEVMADLKGNLEPDQIVLSIVAGVGMSRLQTGLNHDRLIRTMPNAPAQIGAGITVWTTTEAVTPEQKAKARSIISALGEEVFVEDEKYLDMATAVSGSGPAYVFLFIEALTDAAVHIGLPHQLAAQLALETVHGSSLFAKKSDKHPAELRSQVSSPGGTTVEGVLALEEGGLRASLTQAVIAAYQRSKELGA